ncbi:MAG: aminopeptidase [Roseburia sp.]|nr:aminopeptidase [Roseburia sp.]
MGCEELFKESNEMVAERYDLVIERIREIPKEKSALEKYQDYFSKVAEFLLLADQVLRQVESGEIEGLSLEECQEINRKLYLDILPENYEESYGNPKAAVNLLGEKFGSTLCFLYAELRAVIGYAFENRKMNMAILCELFVEIYNCFESEEEPKEKEISDIIYGFFHDYSEIFAEDKVRDMVEPSYDFFTGIIMKSDLKDMRYLYRCGEYIGENEIGMAEFLNTLSEEEVQSMADTMTEGYRIGYEHIGKDLNLKDTICLEYPIGFERVIRKAIKNFEKLGLKSTAYRNPVSSFSRGLRGMRGCYVSSVNRQYDFDHKADKGFYLDKAFVERQLESMKAAYEKYKKQAKGHAGPAVTEIFGEVPFLPVIKPEAKQYTLAQNELNVYQMSRMGQMSNEYIPGDERSFTIIAYPIPAIGEMFEEIFRETIKINTLDYVSYQNMQQRIIDVLDRAEKVHITGSKGNKTDLWVQIHPLKNPEKETAFENCVADVNIPVGEVFTSPVLEGTKGKLHVTKVYLAGLRYLNLELDFEDGKITSYTCTNFDTEEENHKFLYENLLQQHDTLPMGEFAIGTNTRAYRMARDYGIEDKLPILIAEKTGPHFAVGDTCYSHGEDTAVFNPDGKEIIARDNSISILRKEDMAKAYFNCHTDITIPYEELGNITAVSKDGTAMDIIREGKFIVPGTEELNEPFM